MDRRNFLQMLAVAVTLRPQAAPKMSLRQALLDYDDWPMTYGPVTFTVLPPLFTQPLTATGALILEANGLTVDDLPPHCYVKNLPE